MAKTAQHSPVRAAATAAGKTRPTRKAAAAKRKSARSANASLATKAVEAVKDIAHKGEELVAKVLGSKGSSKAGKKSKSAGATKK